MPVQAQDDVRGLQAYAQGRLAESMGAAEEALQAYRRALADEPSNLDVAARIYMQAMVVGDAAAALLAVRALEGQPSQPREGLLLLLGDALGRGDWSTAAALLPRIKTADYGFIVPVVEAWLPKEFAVPPLTGERRSLTAERYMPEQRLFLALAARDLDRAEVHLPVALDFLPDGGPGLRLAVAAAFAQAGRQDRALALLSGDRRLAVARAALEAGGKDRKRARRAMALPASAPAPVATPAQGFARLMTRMALERIANRDRSLALRLAHIAAFADPGSDETRIVLARLLGANGHTEAALAKLAGVPTTSWYLTLAEDARIVILERAERNGEALAIVRARAAQPEAGSEVAIALASLLDETGDAAGAAAAYSRAIALHPGGSAPWSLYLRQGDALERSGNVVAAIAAMRTAVQLAPNEPSALNMLGYTQLKNRVDLEEAAATLRRASRMRNNDAAILDSYGWALHLTGDSQGAVTALERAASRAPTNGTIQEHLGDAYWATGRRFEARYAWRRAVLVGDEDAQRRLAAKLEQGLLMANTAP